MVFIACTILLLTLLFICFISLDIEDVKEFFVPFVFILFFINGAFCVAREVSEQNKISIKEEVITRIEILDDNSILINKDVFNLSYLTIIISDKNIIRYTKKEREKPKQWFPADLSINTTEVFVSLDKLPNSEFEIKGNLQKKGEDD